MNESILIAVGLLINLVATVAGIFRTSRCTTVDSSCGCFKLHLERDVVSTDDAEQHDTRIVNT